MNTKIHIIEQLKWILLKLKIIHILTLLNNSMIKILNLKLEILLEYQNTKIFSLKDILQIGMKKFLWLKRLKILFHGEILVMSQLSLISHMISMVKKLLEHCMEKNYGKQISKGLG